MGGLLKLNFVWEWRSRSRLSAFRLWLEVRKAFFHVVWHFFRPFYFWNVCATRATVEVIFHDVHSCRSQDMSRFSHIPKPKTGPCILTPYMDVGLRIMNSMWWIPHRPHPTIQCCGATCAWIAMQKYVRLAAWMNGHSFHIALCHRSNNKVCFVLPSCCTNTTVGSEPTMYCAFIGGYIRTLRGLVQWMGVV